jgi:hypothetical protein
MQPIASLILNHTLPSAIDPSLQISEYAWPMVLRSVTTFLTIGVPSLVEPLSGGSCAFDVETPEHSFRPLTYFTRCVLQPVPERVKALIICLTAAVNVPYSSPKAVPKARIFRLLPEMISQEAFSR